MTLIQNTDSSHNFYLLCIRYFSFTTTPEKMNQKNLHGFHPAAEITMGRPLSRPIVISAM
jgi:hypothetical protein